MEARKRDDEKTDGKIDSIKIQLNDILTKARQDRIDKINSLREYHRYEVGVQKMIVEDFSMKVCSI